MASREKYTHKKYTQVQTVPFKNAEEAWFWFIAAQDARNQGARYTAGQGMFPRPCEAIDILRVLDRLYRNRRLLREHLLVLRHYGRRHLAPDPRRIKEARAADLWNEALERIEIVLIRKEIVRRTDWPPNPNWMQNAFVLETLEAAE